MADLSVFSKALSELVEVLSVAEGEKVDQVLDRLVELLSDLSPLDLSLADHRAVQSQIEHNAVILWNYAVAKKTGGQLAARDSARVRHVASNLVFLCNSSSTEEVTLKKQLMMAVKTARAWLDAGESSMAESPLTMASQCLVRLRDVSSRTQEGAGDAAPQLKKRRGEQNRDKLKVLSYKLEMMFYQSRAEEAMAILLEARELLQDVPDEVCYLSLLCYNFGVDCFKKEDYEHCIDWLRESYDIGKINSSMKAKNQARTLRLLANTYIEWDSQKYCQKALNAIGLANSEHSHPAGLYLKVKVLLTGGATDDRLKAGLLDVLQHSESSVDLGLSSVRLAVQHNRSGLGLEGLELLQERYRGTADYAKVLLTHLELLLKLNHDQQAKALLQTIAQGSGSDVSLETDDLKQVNVLLWEKAASIFQDGDYSEALAWYTLSLELSDSGDSVNSAKLQRNIASCYLGLDLPLKAQEAVAKAQKADSSSPHTAYLQFKTALLLQQEDSAKEALKIMRRSCSGSPTDAAPGEDIHNLICLAAQAAFQGGSREIAVSALEALVEVSSEDKEILTALKCLSRLRLACLTESHNNLQDCRSEITAVHNYIETAYKCLEKLQSTGGPNVHTEASWFMKIAWNMALQCEKSLPDLYSFFLLSAQLTELCGHDATSLSRQKTCLLMATAASLETVRFSGSPQTEEECLRRALSHIDRCREVCHRIEESRPDTETPSKDVTSHILLALYEFEAKVKLSQDTSDILSRLQALPQVEPKAFETLAALAMEGQTQNREVSIQALRLAIKGHLKTDVDLGNRLSKVYHSLLALALDSYSTSDPAITMETVFPYFTEVTDVIETRAKDCWPPMEILWLMTKAWNCGVQLHSVNRYDEALLWCDVAQRLLAQLGSLKLDYQEHMTSVYEEILSKHQQSRGETD